MSVRRPAGGGTRYELLETLREYGRSRMSYERRAEVFGSHAARFAALARFVEEEIRTPGERQAIEVADASFADLRAAQRFALETGDLDTAIGLIVSSREFAMRAMRYELFAWADAASRADGCARPPSRSVAHGSPCIRRVGPRRVRARGRTGARDPRLGGWPRRRAERAGGAGAREHAARAERRRRSIARLGTPGGVGRGVRRRVADRARVLHGGGRDERPRRSRRRHQLHRPRPRARRRDRQPDRPRLGRGRRRLRQPQRRGSAGGLPRRRTNSHGRRETDGWARSR